MPTRGAKPFFDTNVLLYLLSADTTRADRVEAALVDGGDISVQVLNEFAAVAVRKLGLTLGEVREILATVRALCSVVPLTGQVHDHALQIAETHRLSIYDAMIVAAALRSGSATLLSEDLQHGQEFEGQLKVRNPFR